MKDNPKPECPACESENSVCNGQIRGERQSYRCNDCGRRFILNGAEPPVRYNIEQKVDILLHQYPSGIYDRQSRLSINALSKQTGIRRATLSNWLWNSHLLKLVREKLNAD
jgi:transposase-like protein